MCSIPSSNTGLLTRETPIRHPLQYCAELYENHYSARSLFNYQRYIDWFHHSISLRAQHTTVFWFSPVCMLDETTKHTSTYMSKTSAPKYILTIVQQRRSLWRAMHVDTGSLFSSCEAYVRFSTRSGKELIPVLSVGWTYMFLHITNHYIYIATLYRWLSARLQYLQCVSIGDTAALQ